MFECRHHNIIGIVNMHLTHDAKWNKIKEIIIIKKKQHYTGHGTETQHSIMGTG